jgi:hypothetical protein
MAGSYLHIIDHNGKYRGVDLINHLGDADEALEECHAMIEILTGGDKNKIFEAHREYVRRFNPEYAAEMTLDGYWPRAEDET